jgi:hypothetical protein
MGHADAHFAAAIQKAKKALLIKRCPEPPPLSAVPPKRQPNMPTTSRNESHLLVMTFNRRRPS